MDELQEALRYLKDTHRYNWEDDESYRESFMSNDQRWKLAEIYMDIKAENPEVPQNSEQYKLMKSYYKRKRKTINKLRERGNHNGI